MSKNDAVQVSAETYRAIVAELLAALELIAEDCEAHPAYMLDATDEDMEREGGDAASITYWAQTARDAIAKGQP